MNRWSLIVLLMLAGCSSEIPAPVFPEPEMQVARFFCDDGSSVGFQIMGPVNEYGIEEFAEGALNAIDPDYPTYYGVKGGFRVTGNCWVNVWPSDAWGNP